MRRILELVVCLGTLTALAPAQITVTEIDGRRVYVNDDAPRTFPARVPTPAASRYNVLVYWSRSEQRWKKVPPPSPNAMRAAKTAAAEVSSFVAAQPKSIIAPAQLDPNYRTLARGRRVTSQDIDAAIDKAASRHGVDTNLVRALIKVESNFNPGAVSPKGAMGLMQLMPATARSLAVTNPFDPQQNVDAGVRHLRTLLNNYGGDVRLSLAAYNAGQGAVARSGGIPPYAETRDYVRRITKMYGGGLNLGQGGVPVRMFRGSDGVLTLSNTD